MTMLGELYANGLGIKRDYAKAAAWYQRAADAGDREGMFALAMMRLSGRGGATNRDQAVKLLASSAKLGNPKAAYNLHSALLNVMVKAARARRPQPQARLRRGRASAGVAEGPGQFRHQGRQARRGDAVRRAAKARPGYGFLGEEGGTPRRRRQDPHLDRRSARRHHQLPARHSAIRDLDRRCSAKAPSSPA
jgi:TPR repeat protein